MNLVMVHVGLEVVVVVVVKNITFLVRGILEHKELLNFSEPKFPDADELVPGHPYSEEEIKVRVDAQRRLCAYRALVFWTWPDIGKHRRPLPSCIYALVRAKFDGGVSDEEYADMSHTEFIPIEDAD